MTDHSDLIAELRDEGMRLSGRSIDRGCVDSGIAAVLADRAAEALTSQSLSLSEAREEIERLRADIAVKAKLLTKSAKETRAFWDALIPKGGRCRDCADFDGRCQGDGPPCDPQAHALENLAKLQAASPDLSSLRKGAEDMRTALKDCAQWLDVILAEKVIVEPENEQHIAASIARARAALVSGSR